MSSNAKKSNHILAFLALMVLLLTIPACEGSTPEVKPLPDTSTPKIATTHEAVASKKLYPSARPTDTPEPGGFALSNPAPFGSEVTINEMSLKVTGLIRPADGMAEQGNMFNTVPEARKEYVFVNLSATCNRSGDKTCNINDFDFKMVGSSRQSHEAEIYLAGVSGMLGDGDFLGGATKSGYIAFIVDKSETNLILIYAPFLGYVAYFSAEQ